MTHHKPNIEFRLMTNAIIENNYNQENIFMFTCFALKERNVMKKH